MPCRGLEYRDKLAAEDIAARHAEPHGPPSEDGIILTGGSARLAGFEKLLSKKTKIAVHTAEEPENCVVNGAGKAIRYIDDMENKEYGVLNPLSAAY